jgi:hypothetical protein
VGKIDLKPLVRSTEEDFVNDFPLNALGAVHLARLALRASKAGGDTSAMVLFPNIAASRGFVSHASVAKAK